MKKGAEKLLNMLLFFKRWHKWSFYLIIFDITLYKFKVYNVANFIHLCIIIAIVPIISYLYCATQGLPKWLSGKESFCQCRKWGFDPWVGKIPWRRQWHPTPVLLPGKSHGQRSLESCGPWGCWGSDMTEWLHFHFSLFTFTHWRRKWQPTPVFLPGESQGRGAWWAAVYGVAQSRTEVT